MSSVPTVATDTSDGELSVPTTPRSAEISSKVKDDLDYKIHVDPSLLRKRSSSNNYYRWRVAVSLILWFAFSILTSFTNKFILSTRNGDPNVLAMAQILTTTLLGGIKMNTPCCLNKYIHAKTSQDTKRVNFIRNMALVGIMRYKILSFFFLHVYSLG